jgi:hypothetical protein
MEASLRVEHLLSPLGTVVEIAPDASSALLVTLARRTTAVIEEQSMSARICCVPLIVVTTTTLFSQAANSSMRWQLMPNIQSKNSGPIALQSGRPHQGVIPRGAGLRPHVLQYHSAYDSVVVPIESKPRLCVVLNPMFLR